MAETNAGNIVYIGKKPVMNYVLAVVMQFNTGSGEVVIRARGRSISSAVDVAEIVRNRFVPDSKVREIKISTEQMTVTGEENRTVNVSAIEIYMTRKPCASRDEAFLPRGRPVRTLIMADRLVMAWWK